MYAQWPYHLADCQRDHAPTQWEVLKIPHTLLMMSQDAQPSALVALPIELVLLIIAYADPVDRLFLALTCKNMLAISSIEPITIPSAPRHRADHLNCSAMLAIMHAIHPRGTRGRPNKSWALCCVCYRYRPKKQKYWQRKEKRPAKDDVSCGLLANYDTVVENWSHRGSTSYQCPECWCEERINTYGHLRPKPGA
ncbi:hypothetical protein XA68_12675 [Ophiocordyceps unilateralis]|uniref:F-box domain-containing protein n=1 Tax=Ophiocordyceps unilateralis TaxID=268505 RepID=A0A2A9PDV6_OPHUN|nr:hypothetical protein XA68_12675 [Ophiocordyceps unilateralis]